MSTQTLPSQSHSPGLIPCPLQTPHSSSSADPPQTPKQSISSIHDPKQSNQKETQLDHL